MQSNPIKITTTDREIIYAIWDLQDKYKIEEEMAKAFPEVAKEVLVFVKDSVELAGALLAIIQTVKSVKEKNKSDTRISIQLSSDSKAVIQIIEANKGQIDINIENKY